MPERRVGFHVSFAAYESHIGHGVIAGHAFTQLGVLKRSLQLGEQLLRSDHLEVALEPAPNDGGGRAAW